MQVTAYGQQTVPDRGSSDLLKGISAQDVYRMYEGIIAAVYEANAALGRKSCTTLRFAEFARWRHRERSPLSQTALSAVHIQSVVELI